MDGPFQFFGFNPNHMLAAYANAVLERVTELVPADSTVLASLGLKADKFVCKIEVFSQTGPFAAETKDEDAVKALQETEEKIKEFIAKWHTTRFSEKNSSTHVS